MRIIDLYQNKYYDANFTHFAELLASHEQIHVSVKTVASILEAEYILSPKVTKAKKKRITKELRQKQDAARTQKEKDKIQKNIVAVEDAHTRRPRCAYFGELEQMDATPYEWVPGQIWHLHLAIDDATGRITGAWFDMQETLNGYYHVFRQILTSYGIPYKFLTDKRTVFTYKKKNSPSLDEDTYTQFEKQYYRMLDAHGHQIHYRKGTKVMVIKAFDGNLFCCVNDRDIYALEAIPQHEEKSKDLDVNYVQSKPKKKYIPPMNHPWRRCAFDKLAKSQEHHKNDKQSVA